MLKYEVHHRHHAAKEPHDRSLVQGMAFGESTSKAVGTNGALLKAYSTLYTELLELGFSHDHVRTALTALPMVSPVYSRV